MIMTIAEMVAEFSRGTVKMAKSASNAAESASASANQPFCEK
jgi:hypothetical protein